MKGGITSLKFVHNSQVRLLYDGTVGSKQDRMVELKMGD